MSTAGPDSVAPVGRRRSGIARVIIVIVVVAALVLAVVYMPRILLSRQLSRPLWQATTASSDPSLLAAAGRLFVLDTFSLTVAEPTTGRTVAVVASSQQDPIRSVVVGADGSFATYRDDAGTARVTYYSPNGTQRWSVDPGADSNGMAPVWAIADGVVIIHSWYQGSGTTTDQGVRNLLRAIGSDGRQLWSEPTPDGTYSVPAVSAGQSAPGSWSDDRIHLAPTVVVSAGGGTGPITVRSVQGKGIDRTEGQLVGIDRDTVYVRNTDGFITARRAGRQLWRGDHLPLPGGNFVVAFSPGWIHVTENQRRYLISRGEGTVAELQARDLDVMADLIIRKVDHGYQAIDPMTGNRRWIYNVAHGASGCNDIAGGATALLIECHPGSLARLAGTDNTGYVVDVLNVGSGRRSARMLLKPFSSSTWGLSYQPVTQVVSIGPGQVVMSELPDTLIAFG